MITDLLLKFGSAPGVAAVSVPITPVTIFVGPNNSGKSKVLAEIQRFSREGIPSTNDLILEHLRFQQSSAEEAKAAITGLTVPANPGDTLQPGQDRKSVV